MKKGHVTRTANYQTQKGEVSLEFRTAFPVLFAFI